MMFTYNGTGDTLDYNMTDWFNGTDGMFNDTLYGEDSNASMTTEVMTTRKPWRCTPVTRPLCDPYMIAAYNFSIYGIMVNYALGIPGSLLTMILLARMRPFNSASVWLFGMAFLDFINLTFRAIRTVIIDQTGIFSWNDQYCRAYHIFSISTEHAGYLVLTALTVERFIAVWFPLKMTSWCSRRRAAIGLLVIMVVCLATDMHFLKTMRLGVVTNYCVIRKKYRPIWEYMYLDRIQGVLLKVVPLFLLLILNVLIVLKLRMNKGIRSKLSDDQAKEKQRQQRQINRMLMSATFWFSFCVAPNLVYRYTRHLWGYRLDLNVYRAKWIAMNTTSALVLFNHSGNFILYIIAARKFRSELVRLLTFGKFSLDSKSSQSKSTTKTTKASMATSTN